MKCLYISSFRLNVTKTTCGISLWLGTDVCQVMPRGKWDSGPMPQAAALHGTELVWDSRTHRTMYINTKCSPLPKVDKILASQKQLGNYHSLLAIQDVLQGVQRELYQLGRHCNYCK